MHHGLSYPHHQPSPAGTSPTNAHYNGLAVVAAAAETVRRLSMDRHSDDGSPDYGGPNSTLSSPSPPSDRFSPHDTGSNASSGSGSSIGTGSGSLANNRRKGVPYIPSYMDLTNGPEPCVVCGDAATGYHYRCMTCEGCKGFFRRTIQKNLQYHCKYNNQCAIDKSTRNQCQECRFRKCITVGMATDLVLNEKQRVAKRKLIEENRERRQVEQAKMRVRADSCEHERDRLTEEDRALIADIVHAYHNAPAGRYPKINEVQSDAPQSVITDAITPSVTQVVDFAKTAPGFGTLPNEDQIVLLKACCMEIMCLKAAGRYDETNRSLLLLDNNVIHQSEIPRMESGVRQLVEPIFEFAQGLAKLQLDATEVALLAGVLLMQSDRTGLQDPAQVERLQDAILGAFKHYVAEKRPHQPVHWAKILMKVTDIRTISTRHADRLLSLRLDEDGSHLPPVLAGLFGHMGLPGPANGGSNGSHRYGAHNNGLSNGGADGGHGNGCSSRNGNYEGQS